MIDAPAMSQETLTAQLCELVRRWTTHEDVPKSQQLECAKIGRELWALGGMDAMVAAYRKAKAQNIAAGVVQAYWDGIGDFRW